MKHILKYKWFLLGGLVITVLIAALALTRQPPSVAAQPELLVSKTIGNATYEIWFDRLQQRIDAGVNYNYLDRQEIQTYVEWNKELAQELAQREQGPLHTTIIFSRLLDQAGFEAFVKRYELQVKGYFMRAVAPDGRLSGIVGSPSEDELVPQRMLNTAAGDMVERNGTRFKGWAYVVAITDPPHLRRMLQDPDVLAVDGTATLIYDELTPATLHKAGATRETIRMVQGTMDWPTVQITGPGLYRALSNLGLVPVPEY